MPDQPDVANEEVGTRQPSNRIGTDFHLNENFVEAVGPQKAQALMDLLNGMVEEHDDMPISDVADRLRQRLGDIGVQMSEPEITAFADQIVRSERSVGEVEVNPNEAPPAGR